MRRIISVWLRNFPLDRLKWQTRQVARHNCTSYNDTAYPLEDIPFALVHKNAKGLQIATPNDAARKEGVHEGMRLADARALLPGLATQPAEPHADATVLCKLADWCQRYTPLVGIDGTDGLWLDITGAAHLFGGEDDLLADLEERLRAIGFANGLGLADTPGAAWAIARHAHTHSLTNRVVSPNNLLQALEKLPLEALRLDENSLYLLNRFGLKTVGALHRLPRTSLKRRFPSNETCEAVLNRLDQALGRVADPIEPLRAPPAYRAHLPFAEPILATESFHLGLREILDRLTKRMERDRKGATHLIFSAYHADGGVSQVSIKTARVSRDADHLAHLFRDRIENINPGFGVDMLVLSAGNVAELEAEQLAFAGRAACERIHSDLDKLVDRLSNRLGTGNVQRILPKESHIPERSERRMPALSGSAETETPHDKLLRPFRLLPKPEPVQVMAEVPEGPPRQFIWRRVTHRVVRAEGPERIAPEWWHLQNGACSTTARTRDYYRVEDDQGRRFWLFRAGLYRNGKTNGLPVWHMHGMFA